MTEKEFATMAVARLQAAGYQALWAGGCVRDELLGLAPADYDIATSALPEQVMALFRRSHTFGACFGVVEAIGPRGHDGQHLKVQIATFRSDGSYSDGRRPDSVVFSSAEEDAQRRDFTINGMFLDPTAHRVLDFVGGKADLEARILRAIGNPEARFAEDKLRILRAVRMAARFELTVDPATLDAARAMAPQIAVVSAERIAEELRKLFGHRHRARGFRLLVEFGILEEVLPELCDVHEQAAQRLERLETSHGTFSLVFSLLLATAGLGEKETVKIGRRLRLSNEELAHITWLVKHRQALNQFTTLLPHRWKPLLAHPHIEDLLALVRTEPESVEDVAEASQRLRATSREELDPAPLVTGDDLVALGLKPGPRFKQLLDSLRAAQLDGLLTTREAALQSLATELR